MSNIPTIPGMPTGGASGSIGPDGITASINLTLDMCNARPVFFYVVQSEGRIWRLVDPLSPQEKIPVWKEWTEEKEVPQGHWEEVPVPPSKPPVPPPPPPEKPGSKTRCVKLEIPGTCFKFDEPGRSHSVTSPNAYTNPSGTGLHPPSPDDIRQQVDDTLSAPMDDGSPVPSTITRRIVAFAHADMCASFSYNKGLTDRRMQSIQNVLATSTQGALSRVMHTGTCSDFNPVVGPNEHEQAAERSADGFATNPSPGPDGNEPNRRIELYVIPDYTDPSRSQINEALGSIHDQLVAERMNDPRRAISPGTEWARGTLPCNSSTRICHKLVEPFDTPGESPSVGLENRRHQTIDPSTGRATGQGPGYRQCAFYRLFKERIGNLCCHAEVPPEQPTKPPEQPEPKPKTKKVWVEDPPKKELWGEYHPPPGEHYDYHMDDMVKAGVQCSPLFPPEVDVAPNEEENADDFNLIRAGPIQVVKMDIGFWGDERTRDTSREAGFRRVPARYFGLVEGQFVFLCYFETPDNAGFVQPCSTEFDDDLTPLAARLAQAVQDAGNRILIMAKAVAEGGPEPDKLNVFFPDMHLPVKFNEKDPVYSTDECIHSTHMVKSMVLHQLKRDYRLPAEETPWLSVGDRQLCRDFFEGRVDGTVAPTLKLPQYSTDRVFSNPFTPEGEGLAAATDVARKAYQALMSVGYYLFEFSQDDYRRMVRNYADNFPEKGYGRTKDALFNWFYGFETDRNTPPPPDSGPEAFGKRLIPGIVKDVADEHFDTSLNPDPGTPPAQERRDRIDPGPARDLLRFLDIIETQADDIRVFQTGDLYELWVNRRYLFEDFDFPSDPDPHPQMPETAKGLMPSEKSIGSMGVLEAVGEVAKFLGRNFFKLMLGGINADEPDLWFRRECNRFPLDGQLGPETAVTVTGVQDNLQMPRFSGPSTPGPGRFGATGAGPIVTPTVNYNYFEDRMYDEAQERGNGYMVTETRRRMLQVANFLAPLSQDANRRQEDLNLLGSRNVRRARGQEEQGFWNRAIIEKFDSLSTTFVYGNHDCYRGLPRPSGVGDALPYYSEPGLWIEHGHRFEDSNIDGQPWGAFITNLAFEIQELAFGEGILDEYALHREQNYYQPGIMQWFLLVQFGRATLTEFQNPPPNVPAVHPFRISINSHTHVPDLIVGNVIFQDREKTTVDLPLIGSVGADALYNGGAALVKAALFAKSLVEWWKEWDRRHGFNKWWEDIKGNTINWGVDFAGLASCVDEAWEYLKENTENSRRELEDSARSFKNMVDDNLRGFGL